MEEDEDPIDFNSMSTCLSSAAKVAEADVVRNPSPSIMSPLSNHEDVSFLLDGSSVNDELFRATDDFVHEGLPETEL